MNFFTADLHFSHRNIIRFDDRPFLDLPSMHAELIKRWNSVVSPGDNVYVLGDMFWDQSEAPMILEQLNGHIHLIKGNHDKISPEMMRYFSSIKGYDELTAGKYKLILCHYPIMFYNHSYSPECYMLCGHVHNTRENTYLAKWKAELRDNAVGIASNKGNIINVGCMLHDYTPKTLNQLIAWDKEGGWKVE